MSAPEYSQTFLEPRVAHAYEQFYEAGTADEAIWKFERKFLSEFYDRNAPGWPRCSYLDYACGTGRVIAFLEGRPVRSVGIDVSPEMLKIARTKVRRSELFCCDLTSDATVGDKYDLITAFRFFLNAEPNMRLGVLKALAVRLRNENSRLVFNNHGNPWSIKAIAWPIHRVRQWLRGRETAGNYLTHSEVESLVAAANLRIVERTGCGLLSPRLFRLAPSVLGEFEARAGGGKLARAAGVNQIYVVARR
ncbi:MAG: hypothetical protein QOD64_1224 [Verrucomicrobiota bacterium]|jgi:SAM-dependent methyltransferase